jgi:hypothetical protein
MVGSGKSRSGVSWLTTFIIDLLHVSGILLRALIQANNKLNLNAG